MNISPFRLVSAALVIFCAAAPSSATVVTNASSPFRLGAARPVASARGVARSVRIANTALVTVTGPSGCTVSGPSSFVGEPGGSPPTNFAGGAGGGTGYYGGQAAVAAGLENESCDYNTIIGAGEFNKIGGDASSPASAIAAGNGNGIEDTESFMGAGRGNTLSYEQAAPYYAGSDSGIASGVSNTVVSPESFIGAGYMNSVSGNSAAVLVLLC
jgi:hypothetical protein